MIAFGTLITSSIVLIINIINYTYDIIAEKHKKLENRFEPIEGMPDEMEAQN